MTHTTETDHFLELDGGLISFYITLQWEWNKGDDSVGVGSSWLPAEYEAFIYDKEGNPQFWGSEYLNTVIICPIGKEPKTLDEMILEYIKIHIDEPEEEIE